MRSLIILLLSLIIFAGCDSDDSSNSDNSIEVTPSGYTLFTPINTTESYLIDHTGEIKHTWSSKFVPALSVYLLENGELLRPGKLKLVPDIFKGTPTTGGIIEILDAESNVVWSHKISTDTTISHHDVEQLPNGNILAIVWEAKTAEEAFALGRTKVDGETLWGDAIYKICRASDTNSCSDGEIIWRWSVWDHIVQDQDPSMTETYVSDISAHPNKININHFTGKGLADWTHVNAVAYHAQKDQIIISVHNFNEYWIIDHSDGDQGILHRNGNPEAHGGTGEQTLYLQHDAHWIPEGSPGAGDILVFNNGPGRDDGDYSSVNQFCYDGDCDEKSIISSYSKPGSFYSQNISGAQRLPDGNTLVCEGATGRLFEYDQNDDVVWEYKYDKEIFQAYRYSNDYSGLPESLKKQ